MFGWWTGYPTEASPRGQASATMMVSDIGRPGDWSRSLQTPFMDKFTAPSVEGVDFPAMGPYQAWNDLAIGTLNIGTYAASSEKRGAATSFLVTGLPSSTAPIRITANGQPFTRFRAAGGNSIRIDSTVDDWQFRIETGYRGAGQRADYQPRGEGSQIIAGAGAGSASAARPLEFGAQADAGVNNLITAKSVGCSCCPA